MTDIKISAADLEAIRACPLFKGMKEDELAGLLSFEGCSIRDFSAGKMLPADCMLVVLSGSVTIEKLASDGRYLLMREAEPPEALNVSRAFAAEEDISRLIAGKNCRVLFMDGSFVTAALKRGGSFAVNFAEFLVGRVLFLNKKIASLAGYSAGSRLTMYIEDNASMRDGVMQLTLPCSLTDFAEMLGVGRASLYRTLDAMEAEGKITRRGRNIIINK